MSEKNNGNGGQATTRLPEREYKRLQWLSTYTGKTRAQLTREAVELMLNQYEQLFQAFERVEAQFTDEAI